LEISFWSAESTPLRSESSFEDGVDLVSEGIEVRFDGRLSGSGGVLGGRHVDGAVNLGEVRTTSSSAATAI